MAAASGRRWSRAGRVAAVCALSVAFVACSGGDDGDGGAAVPEAATLAPADTAFFISVETDFDGEQWQEAEALLEEFPDGDELLGTIQDKLEAENVDFERDVKPALGPEVGVAGFDLPVDEPPVVVYTKPPDRAKFDALLGKSSDGEEVVTREVDGWVVAAENQADLDRFLAGREEGSLADQDDFRDALEAAEDDALVFTYFGGRAVQEAFNEGLVEEGAPRSLTAKLGGFRSLVSSTTAEEDGVRFDSFATYDGELGVGSYTPELAETLPAGPLFYSSVANLDEPAQKLLEVVRETIPGFSRQLRQAEAALGFSVEDDLIALLDGESALAVYANDGGELPVVVDYVLDVDDEAKARRLMQRLGGLLELAESGRSVETKVGDLDATRLEFTDEDFSLYWAVFDGKLAISTEGERGLGALRGERARLADDDAYTAALDGAGAPDDVAAVVYSDLATAIPYFIDVAEDEGDDVDAKTRRNLEPLKSFVAYATEEDTGLRVAGFVGIE